GVLERAPDEKALRDAAEEVEPEPDATLGDVVEAPLVAHVSRSREERRTSAEQEAGGRRLLRAGARGRARGDLVVHRREARRRSAFVGSAARLEDELDALGLPFL